MEVLGIYICNKSESGSDGLCTARMVLPLCAHSLLDVPIGAPCSVLLLQFLPLAPHLGWSPTSGAWNPPHPAQCLAHIRHWIYMPVERITVSRPGWQCPIIKRDSQSIEKTTLEMKGPDLVSKESHGLCHPLCLDQLHGCGDNVAPCMGRGEVATVGHLEREGDAAGQKKPKC